MSGIDGDGATGAVQKQAPTHHISAVTIPGQHRFSRADQLLISAARDGDASLVLELLACTHTININARDRKSGSTALIVASAWGHPKIVSLLLDKGADSTLHNFEGRSALELSSGRETTLLLLSGLQRSLSPALLLLQAAWQGNLPLVQQVLANGGPTLSLEVCNGEGLTPLMLAVRDIKVFQDLFQQMLLPCYDPVSIVDLLLNAQVEVDHMDNQGRTALHYCVMTPSDTSLKLTQLLLRFGADPNSLDKHSFSPLHFASKAKALDALNALVGAGADVNKRTYAGHTALHIAASHGDVDLASCLLQSGANVTAVTHSGLSALKCSANREMYLLLKGALETSIDGTSPGCLHQAESSGSLKSLDKQHSDGADEQGKSLPRKSRSSRRHKGSTNSKKQQVLFTMRVGLAMTNSPEGSATQLKTSQRHDDMPSPQQSSKPLSAPAKYSNLPSRIPVVSKFGSGDFRVQRMVSPLRGKPCSSCDGLAYKVNEDSKDSEDIHTDSSSDGKQVPDVLKTGANLPLFGKSARRYRRYVPSFVPFNQDRYKESDKYFQNKESIKESHCHKTDSERVQGLFVILDPLKTSSKVYNRNLKSSHYMAGDEQEDTLITKPSVHFCVDSKQPSRQRHPHPCPVGGKSGRKGKTKPAKSDSEIDSKSLLPVKGQSVSLIPPHSRKVTSRLPRKSRDQSNHPEPQYYNPPCMKNMNDLKLGASLGSVVSQMAAVNLQRGSVESSSGLDTSISSDCVSQASAASWIYIPQDQLPQANPISLPSARVQPMRSTEPSNGDLNLWQSSIVSRSNNDSDKESPEHLYDCPLTPPPSIDYSQKRRHLLKDDPHDNMDSDTDVYQWSSDSCATPVGTLLSKSSPDNISSQPLLDIHKSSLAGYQQMVSNKPKFQWTKGKLLGKGAFGMVWCGMTWTGDLIAVKQVKLSVKNPQQATEEYLQIQQEFQMLQKLQHRNIVNYLGTQLEGTIVNIFMQYIAGGSLSQNLSQFGSFAESVISRYSRQILEGVSYLHGSGIVHRDIKGANIMVMPSESGGLIKLIDFGCAKWLHMSLQDSDHYIQSVRGTPYWMAPEVIQQAGCTEKSDIWSVGCVIIEMATTKPPWHDLPPFSAAYAIGQGTSRAKIPQCLTTTAKDFIHSTMHRDPDLRPMASDLLKHVFLTQFDLSPDQQ